MLGETDIPDRLNYDISELGLSVQAAKNLYTHKVNPQVVNALLESSEFANTTNLISGYLDDELAKGLAAQNQLYKSVAMLLKNVPEAVDDVNKLQTPVYQEELNTIERSFMLAVRTIKKEFGNDLAASCELTSQAVKRIITELSKGGYKPNKKISTEKFADAVVQSVSHLSGFDKDQFKKLVLAFIDPSSNS